MNIKTVQSDSIFYVKLSPGRFGIGIVWAASGPADHTVLAVFSPMGLQRVPSLDDIATIERQGGPILLLSDLRPRDGSWPTLGQDESWKISANPLPTFTTAPPIGKRTEVRYDSTLRMCDNWQRDDLDDRQLPSNRLWSALAAEKYLGKILVFPAAQLEA